MEQLSIVEMAKKTAEGMNFLIIKLAERVDELEKENSDLKQKLSAHDDDLK
jgi:hypothetical protein